MSEIKTTSVKETMEDLAALNICAADKEGNTEQETVLVDYVNAYHKGIPPYHYYY